MFNKIIFLLILFLTFLIKITKLLSLLCIFSIVFIKTPDMKFKLEDMLIICSKYYIKLK